MTLYEQLAASIGFGNSKLVPKLFEAIADEDEARFILAASPPATIEEIAEKSGIPLEQAEEMINPLFIKGLLFKSKKPDVTRYYRVRSFVQFHDATVLTPGISQEYLDLWKEFEVGGVTKVNGRWELKNLEMRDLRRDSRTILEFVYQAVE